MGVVASSQSLQIVAWDHLVESRYDGDDGENQAVGCRRDIRRIYER